MRIQQVSILVRDYDEAIAFFTGPLGFELVEDSPATTGTGSEKLWVVVRPPGAETGILLARADGEEQEAAIGRQAAGRVGFFLHVEDPAEAHAHMTNDHFRASGRSVPSPHDPPEARP